MAFAVTSLAALFLAGCSPERRSLEIDAPRTLSGRGPRIGASSVERFGGQAMTPQQSPATSFAFDLPTGWQELPAQQFRNLNLRAPGDVQVWVTLMGPGAGGALANLSRWRDQLGLPPATQAELDVLPPSALLGTQATEVDLLSADSATRLIVRMAFENHRSVFVRMNGAPDAVGAQLEAFHAFCASLRDVSTAMTGTGAPLPERVPAGPGATASANTSEMAGATGAGDFGWSAPAGWIPVGSGPFKLFEFRAGETSCWLSELAGDGGGLVANVQRWAGQAGHPTPSPEEIGALPRLAVLGREATFVELLAEAEADGLLGLVVELDGRTLYVKMAGPSNQLRARRAEFEAFCRSLSVSSIR